MLWKDTVAHDLSVIHGVHLPLTTTARLQLPTLGRVYGLLVMSGQISWRDLIAYAILPYGEGQFWTNASQHYRTFAVQFIAYALEVSQNCNSANLPHSVCSRLPIYTGLQCSDGRQTHRMSDDVWWRLAQPNLQACVGPLHAEHVS